ncbi:MAG: sialidase family protein [Candidatus Nanoarchaeia archaeon]|nr:sialidase family protein [Candidatus Nanoarchaeia archaeon]
MKNDWCSEYDGIGCLIEEDNTKYDLPKKYNIYIDNLKTSKFSIFVGSGTDVRIGTFSVANTGRSYNKRLVKDSTGMLHGLWMDSGSDIQYANSTDNGLTWTSKEILAGTSGYYSLLINSTDGLTAIWDETGTYNIYWSESPDYGVTWKTPAVIPVLNFNSTARLSVGQAAVMDLNNNIHICTTTQRWNSSTSENYLFYANRSAADGTWRVVDVNFNAAADSDTCDIAVDTNGVVYIAASGSTGADVEVWTSANGWGQTKRIMVHSGTGDTVPAIDIDKNNNIVVSWELDSNDLGFANSTASQATTAWTTATPDTGNSNHPDIQITDNGDVYVLYVDSTAANFDILSSFWNITTGLWTARTIIQNNAWATNISYPSIRGSLIGGDIVTDRLDYMYWNNSDAYYYFNWFDVTPNLAVSVTPNLALESSSISPGDSTLLNANCTASGGTLHNAAITLYTNQTGEMVITPTTEGANDIYANDSGENFTSLTSVETTWFNVTGVNAGSYELMIECNGTESWANATTIIDIAAAGNNAPTITDISEIPSQSIAEGSASKVIFTVIASDVDGVAQLDDNSVNATFFRVGETTRSNSSCNWIEDIDSTSARYNCTIEIWYWDGSGAWDVNATVIDINNAQSADYNETFILQETTAMVMAPTYISWEQLTQGTLDSLSNSDPIRINNTGNKDITTGNVMVTAFDLVGETNYNTIPAINFTVNTADACEGTAMVNGTATGITSSILNAGNNSNGEGQEDLYFCLEDVPYGITSQAYSSQSWTLSLI